MEIQQDENEALKAALQSTLRAKEEDLKLYNDMMEETKKVFLLGLRQYRQRPTWQHANNVQTSPQLQVWVVNTGTLSSEILGVFIEAITNIN